MSAKYFFSPDEQLKFEKPLQNISEYHNKSPSQTPPALQMFLYMCRITAWFCERVYLYLIKCLLKIFGIKWRIQDKPKIIDQIPGKCFVLHLWQTIDYDWAWYIISIYWCIIYHNIPFLYFYPIYQGFFYGDSSPYTPCFSKNLSPPQFLVFFCVKIWC